MTKCTRGCLQNSDCDGSCKITASKLLAESAIPFDKACMMVKDLEDINIDLLEALKYVIDTWVDKNGSERDQSDALKDARAAIAKATS